MVKNLSLHISRGSFVFSAREKSNRKGGPPVIVENAIKKFFNEHLPEVFNIQVYRP